MPQRVLLIPGFTALQLLRPASRGVKQKVWWFNPFNLASAGPGVFQLAPNGFSPGPLCPKSAQPIIPFDLSVFSPYAALLTWLASNGYNPQYYSYDWRQGAIKIGHELGLYLATQFPSEPFSVIGHSYGGLIARLAYATYRANSPVNNWLNSVYVAVPHGGSFEAARALSGVQSYFSLLYAFFKLVGTLQNPLSIASNLGGSTPGSVGDNLLATVASWPGLFDLMPWEIYPSTPVSPLLPQLYQAGTYGAFNSHVDQGHLNAARTTQGALNATLTAPRPDESNVIASGFSTARNILDVSKLTDDASWDYLGNGDGVVHIPRQFLPGAQVYQIQSEHYIAADNGTFLSILAGMLQPNTQVVSPAPQRIIGIIPPQPAQPLQVAPPPRPLQGGQQVILDP